MSGALLVISNGGTRRYEIGREGCRGLFYPRQLGDQIERLSLLPPLAPPELPTLEKAVRENILCWLSESVNADKTRDERQYAKNSAAALQSLLKEASLPPVIYVAPAEDP